MEAVYDIRVISALVLYLLLMMFIGLYYYRKTHDMGAYIIGNRSLGAWVTALSAEASDMSGWMMMGVPGAAYLSGICSGWIAVGLGIGTWANWHYTSKRLRKYTEKANDSLTLPDFFQNRYHDHSNLLRVIPAIFIIIFFVIYTSSGFVSGGKLFSTLFNLDYSTAVLLGAVVVVFYTLAGGFMAVCWTDFIQGIMMFFAIVMVPVVAMFAMGGIPESLSAIELANPTFFMPFTNPDGSGMGFIAFISLMGWGLGYFGQPHILIRFMAISSASELRRSKYIAIIWYIIAMVAAVLVGMVGKVFLTTPLTGADVEKVLLVMTQQLFSPFFGGLVMSAVLAAIMSTASSQLLVAASAFSQDIYRSIVGHEAGEKKLVWISRFAVLAISAISISLAMNPDSFILEIVSYAWAGFGAAFGPAVIMSLYWRRATRNGILAGIVVGGVTVLVWKQLALFGLYEIIPGFIFSMIAIYVVSLMDKEPSKEITDMYDNVMHSVEAEEE